MDHLEAGNSAAALETAPDFGASTELADAFLAELKLSPFRRGTSELPAQHGAQTSIRAFLAGVEEAGAVEVVAGRAIVIAIAGHRLGDLHQL